MHLRFTTLIEAPAEAVFATIADLERYTDWLSSSASFDGTTNVTPLPVRLGTTYVDAGRTGKRYGTVTEFNPPASVVFHQPMRVPVGTVDIVVRYVLEPRTTSTHVVRNLELDFQIPAVMKVLVPLLVPVFRKENTRLLAALKRHVESDRSA